MKAYHVYELFDPLTGCTFYVGKGKGGRRFQHERDAIRGKRSRKCDAIRKILSEGRSVGVKITAQFDGEEEAYQAEAERVEEIGLINLTNAVPGGRGGPSKPRLSPTERRISILKRSGLARLARVQRWIMMGWRVFAVDTDVTDAFVGFFDDMKRSIGCERLNEMFAPYGVSFAA